jgi:ketosteroid isomerase-like protein
MRYLLITATLLILASCQELSFRKKDDRLEALNAMEQTDADFSEHSRKNGFKAAFLEYMDEDGTLLRPGRMPIIGADAVEFLSSINDSAMQLTWEPRGGDVARSGDLGYTFGVYRMKDSTNEVRGTYVTVWRKQKDGHWKFALDSGNQGLGEEKADSSSTE